MTFDEFLAVNQISNAAAAEKLGRDVTLIGRYRARAVTPSPQIIADIVDWSSGGVTPRELLALPPHPQLADARTSRRVSETRGGAA